MVRKADSILFTRHEEKKALGRLIIKRKDNSKIGLTEVGYGDVDCIHFAHIRERS